MPAFAPALLLSATLLGVNAAWAAQEKPGASTWQAEPSSAQIKSVFGYQGLHINEAEAQGIRPNVLIALREARQNGLGSSKVEFAIVEIAQDLGITSPSAMKSLRAAIGRLGRVDWTPRPKPMPSPRLAWEDYFHETTNLWNRPDFMNLMNRHAFHPVKISWEDIGRDENSAWGDRISDVGIWVRRYESDPSSAKLALSVRRDSNFRDKVLMVPAEKIKIHTRSWGRMVEKSLPERLRELGLASKNRDRNVIVSNQFAIVPVPARDMRGAWPEAAPPEGVPPRAAFNFSIYPYGSTNFVITDVIEGSHEAIVGPGSHQMLYANIDGQKAPFTASRAEDRQDLLKMERELKAKGMDVDVQRYYLIQIPLRRDARHIQLSNMGTPPLYRPHSLGLSGDAETFVPEPGTIYKSAKVEESAKPSPAAGLDRVAIGHGEAEGAYFTGSGYQGARAEEPIRVTVVYFVTPVGRITEKDMATFAQAFSQWDAQAIWGGSFVTKETN